MLSESTGIIGIGASAIGAFSFGFPDITGNILTGLEALKAASPYLLQDLAAAGISGLGSALSLDPRITALISAPVRAAVGNGIQSLLSADGFNSAVLLAAVKNGLYAGAKSIGWDVGGNSNGLFGSLTSGSITKSIEASIGKDGLFDGVINVLKNALLNPFNVIGGAVKTVLHDVRGFGSLIQEKGITGAFESLAGSIFQRSTIEKIVKAGGMSGFLGSAAKASVLFAGEQAEEWKLGASGVSLFFNAAGELVGKIENGVTQSGLFGFDKSGKWGLIAGKVIGVLADSLTFIGEVADGQLMQGTISGSNGTLFELLPEDNGGPIIIEGPESGPVGLGAALLNIVLRHLPLAIDLFFKEGKLQKVNAQLTAQNNSNSHQEKLLYLLVNGVNNTDRTTGSGYNSKPHYYENLRDDLYNIDKNISPTDDIAIASIYPNIKLPESLKFAEKTLNRFKDVLLLRAEADIPFAKINVVGDIINQLGGFNTTRPVFGLGYSGGFAPMLEAMNDLGLQTKMIAGVGAATINLAQIKDTLNMLASSIFALENERVLNQNGDDFVKKAKNILNNVYDATVAKIPILGKFFRATLDFMFGTVQRTIDWVANAVHTIIDMVGKALEQTRIQWLLNNQALFGLSRVKGVDGVLNIFGDRDLLVDLGIAGKMSSIAGYSGDRVLDIEIKSYTDPSGLEAVADHYIYMREIRNYTEIDSPARRDLQKQFDLNVANFVARLLVAGTTKDNAKAFLAEFPGVVANTDGSYEFYPFGVPS